MLPVGGAVDRFHAQPQNQLAVGLKHGKRPAAQGEAFAGSGYVACLHAEVAADGVHLVRIKVHAHVFKVFKQRTAGKFINIVACGADVFFARGIVLVFNIAHDFFQHVLNGDEARGAAVLVQGNGNVLLARAKFLQQGADGFCFWYKKRFAYEVGQR